LRRPAVRSVEMSTELIRPTGNCPCCHRVDVSHRVIIGSFERVACRMCADGYKKTPGVVIEALTSRQIQKAHERVL
jgi:ribosomal protein L37AE/L43A